MPGWGALKGARWKPSIRHVALHGECKHPRGLASHLFPAPAGSASLPRQPPSWGAGRGELKWGALRGSQLLSFLEAPHWNQRKAGRGPSKGGRPLGAPVTQQQGGVRLSFGGPLSPPNGQGLFQRCSGQRPCEEEEGLARAEREGFLMARTPLPFPQAPPARPALQSPPRGPLPLGFVIWVPAPPHLCLFPPPLSPVRSPCGEDAGSLGGSDPGCVLVCLRLAPMGLGLSK